MSWYDRFLQRGAQIEAEVLNKFGMMQNFTLMPHYFCLKKDEDEP